MNMVSPSHESMPRISGSDESLSFSGKAQRHSGHVVRAERPTPTTSERSTT